MVKKIEVLTDRMKTADTYGYVGNAKALLDLSSKMMTTEGLEAQLDIANQMVASALLLKEECTRALLIELSEFKMDERENEEEATRQHLQDELIKIIMMEAKNTEAKCDLEDTEKFFRTNVKDMTSNQLRANIILEISSESEIEEWEDEAREIVEAEPDSQYDYDNRVNQVLEQILLKEYNKHA